MFFLHIIFHILYQIKQTLKQGEWRLSCMYLSTSQIVSSYPTSALDWENFL